MPIYRTNEFILVDFDETLVDQTHNWLMLLHPKAKTAVIEVRPRAEGESLPDRRSTIIAIEMGKGTIHKEMFYDAMSENGVIEQLLRTIYEDSVGEKRMKLGPFAEDALAQLRYLVSANGFVVDKVTGSYGLTEVIGEAGRRNQHNDNGLYTPRSIDQDFGLYRAHMPSQDEVSDPAGVWPGDAWYLSVSLASDKVTVGAQFLSFDHDEAFNSPHNRLFVIGRGTLYSEGLARALRPDGLIGREIVTMAMNRSYKRVKATKGDGFVIGWDLNAAGKAAEARLASFMGIRMFCLDDVQLKIDPRSPGRTPGIRKNLLVKGKPPAMRQVNPKSRDVA